MFPNDFKRNVIVLSVNHLTTQHCTKDNLFVSAVWVWLLYWCTHILPVAVVCRSLSHNMPVDFRLCICSMIMNSHNIWLPHRLEVTNLSFLESRRMRTCVPYTIFNFWTPPLRNTLFFPIFFSAYSQELDVFSNSVNPSLSWSSSRSFFVCLPFCDFMYCLTHHSPYVTDPAYP